MNDYLGALIARSLGRIETIRPRPRSMFEPARQSLRPLPVAVLRDDEPPARDTPLYTAAVATERRPNAREGHREPAGPRPSQISDLTPPIPRPSAGNPAEMDRSEYSKIPLERKKTPDRSVASGSTEAPVGSPAIPRKIQHLTTTQQRRPEPDDDTAQVRGPIAQRAPLLPHLPSTIYRFRRVRPDTRSRIAYTENDPRFYAVPRTPRDDERGQSGRSGHAAATDKQILENSALQISRSNPGLDARFKTGAESDLALTKQTHADLVTPERLHCEPGRTAECRFPSPPQNTSKAAIRVPAAIMRRMGHDSPYLASPRGDEVVQVTIGRVEVRARPAPSRSLRRRHGQDNGSR